MTQHQLAQAAGVPQPTIARIERGTVLPRTATLIELLTATGHRLGVEPIGPPADQKAIRQRLAMAVPQRTRASMRPSAARLRILRRLRRFNVPFVLIGELAELAHGSPARFGGVFEVCHASTDVAIQRLALAREDLGPAADASHLRLVTQTDAGDDYDVLARNAVGMHVDAGILVRVAALDDLIRARRARRTPEDEEAGAVLLAIQALGAETPGRQGAGTNRGSNALSNPDDTDDESEFPHGIGRVARRELASQGFTRYDQLTGTTRRTLLAIHGVGPRAVRILGDELAARGASFADASELLASALRRPTGSQSGAGGVTWRSARMGARLDLDDKEALRRALDGR